MNGAGTLTLASPPRYWPGEDLPPAEERPLRRWRVLHACDGVGETAAVVEAQIQAGMRPLLLTPQGWYRPLAPHPASATARSLVHEWQQVRRWRTRFNNEIVDEWAEVLHAHCFAAAMAGLRGRLPVVYDLVAPIGSDILPSPGAWLLRSLRAAEQFALTRAAAVVAHGQAMASEAMRRGVQGEDLFLVPDPVEPAEFAGFSGDKRGPVVLFAPQVGQPLDGPHCMCVLQAFATLRSEVEKTRLRIEIPAGRVRSVMSQAARAGISDAVEVVAPAESARALAEAEIVIAGIPADAGPNRTVITALAHGRAVLAADIGQNREVTPQGRGCIWYRPDDARDLAGRAAFLARNPDFRTALAVSGRTHLQATRSAHVVARKYDDVYRHAFERRHRGGMDPLAKLEMVRASR